MHLWIAFLFLRDSRAIRTANNPPSNDNSSRVVGESGLRSSTESLKKQCPQCEDIFPVTYQICPVCVTLPDQTTPNPGASIANVNVPVVLLVDYRDKGIESMGCRINEDGIVSVVGGTSFVLPPLSLVPNIDDIDQSGEEEHVISLEAEGMQKYVIEDVLGEGSFGIVLKVHLKDNEIEKFAVKKLKYMSDFYLKLAQREAATLKKLKHRNIIRYVEDFISKEDLRFYFVCEFANAGDLFNLIKSQKQKGQKFSKQQIVKWFTEIVCGMAFAHGKRIMHRDIKVQGSGGLKMMLADLGLARELDDDKESAATKRIGTQLYMSPEMTNQKKYSYANDIWALGCILFELCLLKRAVTEIKDVFKSPPSIIKSIRSSLGTIASYEWLDFSKICDSIFVQDPKDRPSCESLLKTMLTIQTRSIKYLVTVPDSELASFLEGNYQRFRDLKVMRLSRVNNQWIKRKRTEDCDKIASIILSFDPQSLYNTIIDLTRSSKDKLIFRGIDGIGDWREGGHSIWFRQVPRNPIQIASSDHAEENDAQHADVRYIDSPDWFQSVKDCDFPFVKSVLEINGIEINSMDETSQTALHIAAANNDVDIIKIILAVRTADVHMKNQSGQTPLLIAIENNNLEAATVLLAMKEENYFNFESQEGQQALTMATTKGYIDLVEVLEKRAEFERAQTSLHLAVTKNDIGSLNDLLNRSDMLYSHVRNDDGDTPLLSAKKKSSKTIVSLLEDRAKMEWFNAAENYNSRILYVLLASKTMNINSQNADGNTVLHILAANNRAELLKMLLDDNGVELYAKNNDGRTALDLSANNENYETIVFLKAHVQADLESWFRACETTHDSTTLYPNVRKFLHPVLCAFDPQTTTMYPAVQSFLTAPKNPSLDIVTNFFQKKDFDVNIKNEVGEVGLNLAIRNDNIAIVRALLQHSKIDVVSCAPLQEAALNDNVVAVKALLGHKHIQIKEHEVLDIEQCGPYALYMAICNKSAAVVKTLLQNKDMKLGGTTFSHEGKEFPNVLFLAARFANSDIVQAVLEHKDATINFLNSQNDSGNDNSSALHEAARNTDAEVVSTFLMRAKDLNVNLQDKHGHTVLHETAQVGNIDAVRKLLRHPNIKPNLQNENGATPLLFAVRSGSTDTVKTLLEYEGINVNLPDKDGSTPLTSAASSTSADVIKALLECENVNVNFQGWLGFTALHKAASNTNSDVARALLKHKDIDVNLQDKDGFTALFCAVSIDNADVFHALLEHEGSNINLQANDGSGVLHQAARGNSSDAVRALLKHEKVQVNVQNWFGLSALHKAACNTNAAVTKAFLQRDDLDINLQDKHGNTALFFAVNFSNSEVVKDIVEHKDLNVNLLDNNGHSALFYAAFNRADGDVATVLLGHKDIYVNLMDKFGFTALSLALSNEDQSEFREKIFQWHSFLEEGIEKKDGEFDQKCDKKKLGFVNALLQHPDTNVNLSNRNGMTALHKVCYDCNPDSQSTAVVKALLDHQDINVNLQDSKGKTALHYAGCSEDSFVESRDQETVKALLRHKDIDANLQNGNGSTALIDAISKTRHFDTIQALLEFPDLDVDIQDKTGTTALMAARKDHKLGRSESIIDLLRRRAASYSVRASVAKAENHDVTTTLHYAASDPNLDVINTFLNRKDVNINARDSHGFTALHVAATNKNSDVIKAVLECEHVDVNLTDEFGFTPLHAAVSSANVDGIKVLLRRNDIDVNFKDDALYRCAPFHTAARSSNAEVVRALLEHKDIDINLQMVDGSTALHQAAYNTNPDVARALLEHKDINVNLKMTPLHLGGPSRTPLHLAV
eukprot:gene261-317_t